MLKIKYSGDLDPEINSLDLDFLDNMLEQRRKEEETKYVRGKRMKIKMITMDQIGGDQDTTVNKRDLIDDYGQIKRD